MYTQRFNRRHGTVGHVFQGRYKAILVQKETHLLELCRYVILNPVRVGMVEKPEEWKWSSYAATAGIKKAPECLTTDWILSQFSASMKAPEKGYMKFVRDGILHKMSLWERLRGQILLGDEGFIERFRDALTGKEEIREIPRQ